MLAPKVLETIGGLIPWRSMPLNSYMKQQGLGFRVAFGVEDLGFKELGFGF